MSFFIQIYHGSSHYTLNSHKQFFGRILGLPRPRPKQPILGVTEASASASVDPCSHPFIRKVRKNRPPSAREGEEGMCIVQLFYHCRLLPFLKSIPDYLGKCLLAYHTFILLYNAILYCKVSYLGSMYLGLAGTVCGRSGRNFSFREFVVDALVLARVQISR